MNFIFRFLCGFGYRIRGPLGSRLYLSHNFKFRGMSLPSFGGMRIYLNAKGQVTGFGLPSIFGTYAIFNTNGTMRRLIYPLGHGFFVSAPVSKSRKRRNSWRVGRKTTKKSIGKSIKSRGLVKKSASSKKVHAASSRNPLGRRVSINKNVSPARVGNAAVTKTIKGTVASTNIKRSSTQSIVSKAAKSKAVVQRPTKVEKNTDIQHIRNTAETNSSHTGSKEKSVVQKQNRINKDTQNTALQKPKTDETPRKRNNPVVSSQINDSTAKVESQKKTEALNFNKWESNQKKYLSMHSSIETCLKKYYIKSDYKKILIYEDTNRKQVEFPAIIWADNGEIGYLSLVLGETIKYYAKEDFEREEDLLHTINDSDEDFGWMNTEEQLRKEYEALLPEYEFGSEGIQSKKIKLKNNIFVTEKSYQVISQLLMEL